MAEFKFEDVFESDFFEKIANGFEQIKQKAKEFEVVLLNLSKAFADKAQDEFNKDILLSIDYLQKSKQVFLDLQKVIEQNKKLESEVQKLKADLNKIRAEEKKVISELKKVEEGALAQKVKEQVITRELIKDLKEEVKSKIALESANDLLNKSVSESFNSYNELTETLEKLKRVYKDLAAAGQENTEMGKKVAEAITKLDIKVNQINEDVGEFRKLVGSYANEISKSLENVGQELAGDFASNLRNTFNVASAGINELIINLTRARSAVQAVSIAFNVLGKTIKNIGIALLIDAAIAGISKLVELFQRRIDFEKGSLETLQRERELRQAQLATEFNLLDVKKKYNAQSLFALEKEKDVLLENLEIEYQKILLLKQAIERQIQYLRISAEQTRNEEDRKRALEEITNLEFRLDELSNSLLENEIKRKEAVESYSKAKELANKKLKEFLDKTIALSESAKLYLDYKNNIEEIKEQAGELLLVFDTFTDEIAQIENASRRLKALELQNFVKGIKDLVDSIKSSSEEIIKSLRIKDVIDEINETYNKYLNLEKQRVDLLEKSRSELESLKRLPIELQNANKENIKTLEETIKNLQTLEGAYKNAFSEEIKSKIDSVSSSLRDLLSSYTLSDEQRIRASAEKTIKDLDSRFENYKKYVESLVSLEEVSLEEKKRLSDELLIFEKQVADARLLINQKAEEEIIMLRERKLQEQKKSDLDYLEKQKELLDLRLQLNKKSFKNEQEFEIEKLRLQEKYYEDRLAILKEYSDEESRFQAEKLKLEIAILRDSIKELENQAQRDVFKGIVESAIKAYEEVNQVMNKIAELRMQSLEKERDKINKQIDFLFTLAERGSVRAQQNVIKLFEQEKELRRKEQEEKVKQYRREALLAALKSFSNILEKTKDSRAATLEAISAIGSIFSFVSTLPKFYEGTEYVSSDIGYKLNNVHKDSIIARLHEGERVVPAHINRELNGIKNEELPTLINKNNKGIYFDYDSFEKTFISIIKDEGKTIKNRIKL